MMFLVVMGKRVLFWRLSEVFITTGVGRQLEKKENQNNASTGERKKGVESRLPPYQVQGKSGGLRIGG